MGALQTVIRAAMVLAGERNAPELPLPMSAIEAYAKRHKMSSIFVGLVREYDVAVMSGAIERMKGGSSSDKTVKKLL